MTSFTDVVDDVSRETLVTFAEMLARWSKSINLVGPIDPATLWDRHILDSQRLIHLIQFDARTYLDLGSGGGLPGMVVSMLRPDLEATLVEADTRKCAFLRAVRREFDLKTEIVCERIESVAPIGADVISARALAPLPSLLTLATPHGTERTRYIFPKGVQWEKEVALAEESWVFDLKIVPAVQDHAGPVLVIENVSEKK